MEYYSHSDYPIMIGHFPGKSRIESADILHAYKDFKFIPPFNVEFISIITKDYLESGRMTLDHQLRLNHIGYLNPAKKYKGKWNNSKKIGFIIKALKKTKKEYSLILDGADVVIMSDLSDIIKRFNSYKTDILFNATIWPYPKVTINDNNINPEKKYSYLNAGCVLGKTKELLKFYEKCQKIIKKDKKDVNPSEQFYVRQATIDTDNVKIDTDCKIFQVWHKPNYRIRYYVE